MLKRVSLLWAVCFLSGFLSSQTASLEISGEPGARAIFARYFQNRCGLHYQWGEDRSSSFHLSYRPALPFSGTESRGTGDERLGTVERSDREASEQILGRLPLLLVVNFWNPVSTLSLPELEAILSGEITNWSSVGGADLPIKVVAYAAGGYPRLPGPSLVAQLVPDQQAMVAAVAGDRQALGVITWPAVHPEVKVLTLETVNPAWVESDHALEEYPLWTDLVLTTSRRQGFRDWLNGNWWRAFRFQRELQKSYHPGKILSAPAPLVFTAVGDIMLAREVAKTSVARGDYCYPFRRTVEVIRRSTLAFANLEGPLSDRGRQLNMFRADPRFIEGLLYAGFDVLSLANNHIMDYGTVALVDTMERLAEKGLHYVGADANLARARQGCLITANGLKVGFLAYTEVGPGFTYTREPQHWIATAELPGVVPARADYLRKDVARMREQADLVFVSLHWGREYQHEPTQKQRILGQTALAAGADLVIGHHPHVIQGVEFGSKGVIAYSLGNFIFDLTGEETKQGLILEAACDKQGVRQVRFLPIEIRGVRPQMAEGRTARRIMELLDEVSAKLE
ncbi:MAG: hypothetical protein GX050_06150 [Firmicutes bacterium]|nr:hypothetical protein [Bacillota bacterium]